MKKSIWMVIILILIATSILSVAGCDRNWPILNLSTSHRVYNYEVLDLVLDVGETYTINVNKQFEDAELAEYSVKKSKLEFDKYELQSNNENAVTVKDKVLTAVDMGFASIDIVLMKKEKSRKVYYAYQTVCVYVYVIDETAMTEIRTAQQLADIKNDLAGNYILKADIDLKNWGEWTSIGSPTLTETTDSYFMGMFINRGGYKIKNLTITTGKTEKGAVHAGLFAYAWGALFSGIILENVNIDCSDYEGDYVYSPRIGGLAVYTWHSRIIDCSVSGNLTGQLWVGGIVYESLNSRTSGCKFTGTIEADAWNRDIGHMESGIGGIAALYYLGNIKDCTVQATINGNDTVIAGGIVGSINSVISLITKIANCTFEGKVTGFIFGEIVGYDQINRYK